MLHPAILTAAGILTAATAVQLYPAFVPAPTPTKAGELATIVPAAATGWRSQDLPIADTEEMKAVVEDRLQFDDHIVRLYQRGSTQVVVYVAYWTPGKSPYRMVGAHSPDTCWVQNGWGRAERSVWTSCPDGTPLAQKTEYGVYTRPGTRQHVLFFHMVGPEAYAFEQEGLHNPFAIFHDFLTFGLSQRKEQFFVRVSSNVPFEEIWDDRGFQEIVRPLWALGRPAGTVLPGTPPAQG